MTRAAGCHGPARRAGASPRWRPLSVGPGGTRRSRRSPELVSMGWNIWGAITRWVARWRADDTGPTGRDERASPLEELEYDPRSIESRADIYTELGLRPAQFVRRIVEQEGGWVRQRDLGRYADFSPSTVCRMLQDLEEEGVVERYRLGRGKIVTLATEPGGSTVPPGTGTTAGPSQGSAKPPADGGEVSEVRE